VTGPNRGRQSAGAAGLLVAVIVVIVIIVANKGTTSPNPGSGTSAHPASDDVTVTCAPTDSVGFMHSNVTITNHSSQTSDYVVTISFNDAQGNRLQEGTATQDDVAPGQTATTDGMGDGSTGGTPASCVVANVTRYASSTS